jgi:hypothetical protein
VDDSNVSISNGQISNATDVTGSNSNSSDASSAAAAWRKQLVAVTDDHNFRVLSLNKVWYDMLC